jgi:hypothetical protein
MNFFTSQYFLPFWSREVATKQKGSNSNSMYTSAPDTPVQTEIHVDTVTIYSACALQCCFPALTKQTLIHCTRYPDCTCIVYSCQQVSFPLDPLSTRHTPGTWSHSSKRPNWVLILAFLQPVFRDRQ